MILTASQIQNKQIVQLSQPAGQRATTYDATVGEIICAGKPIEGSQFVLKSRGVVWVVSHEDFRMPTDITGLVTLRTSWAHEGVFALNVGVIDPGWQGPLATALVNFSKEDFTVTKGEAFFRILFLENSASESTRIQDTKRYRTEYIKEITQKSRVFSDTFLNMTSLVDEVSQKVFSLPKLAYRISIAAILIALLAIYIPIAHTVYSDHKKDQVTLGILEKRVAALENEKE